MSIQHNDHEEKTTRACVRHPGYPVRRDYNHKNQVTKEKLKKGENMNENTDDKKNQKNLVHSLF